MNDWPDFDELNWNDLYPKLLLYAAGRLNRIPPTLRRLGGSQAQDFAQLAIMKAKNGTRSYDLNRTVYENFTQIISSEISHHVISPHLGDASAAKGLAE